MRLLKLARIVTPLQPHQQRVVDRIQRDDQPGLVVAHGMGSGKAQPMFAKVLTPTGWTTMGEVVVGTLVVGSDGKPTEVVGVFPQGVKAVYRVQMSDGSSTMCCDDHLWQVNTAKRKKFGSPPRVKTLREIRERLTDKHGNRLHFVPMVDPVRFRSRRLPLDPYLLGVLLGDGGLTGGTPVITSADQDLVDRVAERLPAGLTLYRKGDEISYYCSSGPGSKFNALKALLNHLGLWGHRSHEKFIPPMYLIASVSQRLDLLQGLMDTDGYGNRCSCQFVSTSRLLADGVREIVMSLGGCASISSKSTSYEHLGEKRAGRRAYVVNIRMPRGVPPFWMERKTAKLGQRTKYAPTRSIEAVEYVGEFETQCIKVAAQDSLYVTDDYIVTHNTLTSLAATDALGGRTNVVVPAALQANYRKEIKKHVVKPNTKYKIDSLQRIARQKTLGSADNLVVDEAHRLRDAGSHGAQTIANAKTNKRLLLTGTPFYNHPHDIASLVNIASGDEALPSSREGFEDEYVQNVAQQPGFFAKHLRGLDAGEVKALKNKDQLKGVLDKWVDYHENSQEGFPTRRDVTVETPLSPHQQDHYQHLVGEAPSWLQYKIKKGLPPSKREAANLNAFMSGVRQVSVSPGGFNHEMTPEEAAQHSPKIQMAASRLQKAIAANPQHRAIIYSNYLDAGINPYAAELKKRNIGYGQFTGAMSKADRDAQVLAYNSGKTPVLMLSSAGGEGLDLKGTRQIQLMDPHFNKEKLEQVIARGIRYQSHADLPEDQRNVDVEHYISTMPEPGKIKKFFGGQRDVSADEYLRRMSADKDRLNEETRALLRPKTSMPVWFGSFLSEVEQTWQ